MTSEDQSLEQYADDLYRGEDDLLRSMREEAIAAGIPAIQVPTELGRVLSLLVRAINARRVLEIGALFGYSTVLLGRALPPGGTLVSLEIDAERAELVRRNLARAGLDDRASVIAGSAADSLATLTGQVFDLVFIDADKVSYPTYLEWAVRLTGRGSIIVGDNVWRGGSVLHPKSDQDARGAAGYNQALAQDRRFLTTLLPARAGADAASIALRIAD